MRVIQDRYRGLKLDAVRWHSKVLGLSLHWSLPTPNIQGMWSYRLGNQTGTCSGRQAAQLLRIMKEFDDNQE